MVALRRGGKDFSRRDVATKPDGQRALTLWRDRSYCGCICGEMLMRTAAAHNVGGGKGGANFSPPGGKP